MRKDIEILIEDLQNESERINNESEFAINDKIQIVDDYNKNYINKTGKIISRKDFNGMRVILFNNGEMRRCIEDYIIKL